MEGCKRVRVPVRRKGIRHSLHTATMVPTLSAPTHSTPYPPMLAQRVLRLSSSRVRQLRFSADRALTAIEDRLASHPAHQPLLKSDVQQWLQDVRLEAAPQSATSIATGPIVRSVLTGAAIGSVTPVFMLLPLLVVFVPISAFGGVEHSAWALQLLAPWLVNKPVALANCGAATCFTLCREVIATGKLPMTISGQLRSGAMVGMAVGAATPFVAPALALPLAKLLLSVGIPCDGMTIALATIAHEHQELALRSACLLVTLPMGIGAGALTSVMLVPTMLRGPIAMLSRVLPLVVAWVIAVWVWSEPQDADFVRFAKEKFEAIEHGGGKVVEAKQDWQSRLCFWR